MSTSSAYKNSRVYHQLDQSDHYLTLTDRQAQKLEGADAVIDRGIQLVEIELQNGKTVPGTVIGHYFLKQDKPTQFTHENVESIRVDNEAMVRHDRIETQPGTGNLDGSELPPNC